MLFFRENDLPFLLPSRRPPSFICIGFWSAKKKEELKMALADLWPLDYIVLGQTQGGLFTSHLPFSFVFLCSVLREVSREE